MDLHGCLIVSLSLLIYWACAFHELNRLHKRVYQTCSVALPIRHFYFGFNLFYLKLYIFLYFGWNGWGVISFVQFRLSADVISISIQFRIEQRVFEKCITEFVNRNKNMSLVHNFLLAHYHELRACLKIAPNRWCHFFYWTVWLSLLYLHFIKIRLLD